MDKAQKAEKTEDNITLDQRVLSSRTDNLIIWTLAYKTDKERLIKAIVDYFCDIDPNCFNDREAMAYEVNLLGKELKELLK